MCQTLLHLKVQTLVSEIRQVPSPKIQKSILAMQTRLAHAASYCNAQINFFHMKKFHISSMQWLELFGIIIIITKINADQ